METFISMMVVVILVLLGLIVWVLHKRQEARAREKIRKEELYSQLLESLVSIASFGESAPFLVESQRSWLYANDEVIKKINAYIGTVFVSGTSEETSTEEHRNKIQEAEYELRVAVRKDMVPNTGITLKWMRSNWVPVGTKKENYAAYMRKRA